MKTEEAKFILSAYRPDGSDSSDPAMEEALRMVGGDPVLAAWFERSRSHDRAVAHKLRQIAPPKDLRETILAGVRAGQSQRRSGMGWAWIGGLAAAASLAIGVIWVRAPVPKDTGTAALAEFAINDMVVGKHGGRGEPSAALIAKLQTVGAKMPGADTVDFEKLKDTGCRTLNFAGHDVMEVCFAREGVEFHFYVTRREGPVANSVAEGPSFLVQAAGAAAVWSDARFDYALATTAGIQTLRKLL